jgi:hypothetical protein
VKIRIFGTALLLLFVLDLPPNTEAESAAVAASFRVGGLVASPSDFDLVKLEKLPAASQKSGAHEYTGVLLWDLLQSTRIILGQSINNDILRKIVIVTGCDGYETVFSAGEIDPQFGGHRIMIVYAKDGHPLGPDRFPQIVAPGDKKFGRFVYNIVKIEVRDAEKSSPQP